MTDYTATAEKIQSRIKELASFSEDAATLTRTYGSGAYESAADKVLEWMKEAGLIAWLDNIGNVRGRLNAKNATAKTLVIGSHIDTVVNAGMYDGPLGVIMAISMIENVAEKEDLPFHIELIGFCDEEGVRFHTTFLGSKVVAGTFEQALLDRFDKDGISLRDALMKMGGDPAGLGADKLEGELLGYFEMHIEQGPVLFEKAIPVALVTGIAGQRRAQLTFEGFAGHAGTVPMDMRQDALCCAARAIIAIEEFATAHKNNLVATVGKLDIANPASNVIPGKVTCSLDIRSADENMLSLSCTALFNIMANICEEREVSFKWETIQETAPVICDISLNTFLSEAITGAGFPLVELVSGAGHDAVALAEVCPVSMMFIRCYKGISHNPLENADLEDLAAAQQVADNFLTNLSNFYKIQ